MRVSQREVFVVKGVAAEDAGAARAVTIEEVAALDHEVWYLVGGYQHDETLLRVDWHTTRWKVLP